MNPPWGLRDHLRRDGDEMNCMETLQMIITLDDEKPEMDLPDCLSGDELLESAFVRGWVAAAAMAVRNGATVFDDPRDAAELLFDEFACSEEGEEFVESLLGVVFDKDDPDSQLDWEPGYDKSAYEETTRSLGKRGEDAAVRCLESKGYEVLERNWKCRYGEADIIALDEAGTIVFVEVKTRRSVHAGIPEEAVSRAKRRRYENIALEYLSYADWEDGTPVRFDAICICVKDHNRAMLRHHLGFFDACN